MLVLDWRCTELFLKAYIESPGLNIPSMGARVPPRRPDVAKGIPRIGWRLLIEPTDTMSLPLDLEGIKAIALGHCNLMGQRQVLGEFWGYGNLCLVAKDFRIEFENSLTIPNREHSSHHN